MLINNYQEMIFTNTTERYVDKQLSERPSKSVLINSFLKTNQKVCW